jgi:hypothetical protein
MITEMSSITNSIDEYENSPGNLKEARLST